MGRKITVLILILLILSVSLNIYLFTNRNDKELLLNEDISKTPYDMYYNDNPIDIFFEERYNEYGYSAPVTRYISTLYCEAWKEEMNYAYEKLYNKAHDDLKRSIKEMQDIDNVFAKKQWDLGYSVYTFDEEQKTVPTGVISNANNTEAESYKQSTLKLFNYFQCYTEIEIEFIFDENKAKNSLKVLADR